MHDMVHACWKCFIILGYSLIFVPLNCKLSTSVCGLDEIESSGIFPDILHILDLQISVDVICSALLDYTDSAVVIPGASRDARLAVLSERYRKWCADEGLDTRIKVNRV